MTKIVVMQETAEIKYKNPKTGEIVVPEEFEMKQTKDGINYLVAEEEEDVRV